MLASEPDIVFHYCADPKRALETAGLVRPTVILQDLVMPEIDGLTLVKMFRDNAATRDTPMIGVKSGLEFHTGSVTLEPNSKLYIFSDGVYEIAMTNGKLWRSRRSSS